MLIFRPLFWRRANAEIDLEQFRREQVSKEERGAVGTPRWRVPRLVTDMLSSLSVGDEVAILPAADAPPEHVLEIVPVAFVNVHLIRLVDQRIYSLTDGHGLTATSRGFVSPASDAHRAALANKRSPGDDK